VSFELENNIGNNSRPYNYYLTSVGINDNSDYRVSVYYSNDIDTVVYSGWCAAGEDKL